MRTARLVLTFVVSVLMLSAIPVAWAQEQPPGGQVVQPTLEGEQDTDALMRNRADPNYVCSPEELEQLAAKEVLAAENMARHESQKAEPESIGGKSLSVGVWQEPNDYAHRNYCGPGATQVALDARLPASSVPNINTLGTEENIDPNSGVWMSDVCRVLNTRLSTFWYENSGSGSGSQFYSRVVLNIDTNYALVTGVKTGSMPGWGGRNVNHIVAVYGYNEPSLNSQYVKYVETAAAAAGYSGPYWQPAVSRNTFWTYVSGNNTQCW